MNSSSNKTKYNTKSVGNIGEGMFLYYCCENGIPIYQQFGDNEKADFIILINKKAIKIQVKSSNTYNGEITNFNSCATSGAYSEKDVDYFVFCDIKLKQMYFVGINEAPKQRIRFRHTESKNKQQKGILFSKNYLLEDKIKMLMKN